jgi:hypothetical protein
MIDRLIKSAITKRYKTHESDVLNQCRLEMEFEGKLYNGRIDVIGNKELITKLERQLQTRRDFEAIYECEHCGYEIKG